MYTSFVDGFAQRFGAKKSTSKGVKVDMSGDSVSIDLKVLEALGRPSPPIDEHLEHILITGMFNTFFELILHEMPLAEAEHYLQEMRAFYTAGWMKIMGQPPR